MQLGTDARSATQIDIPTMVRLNCYRVELPLQADIYTMSHGRHITGLDSTVVEAVAEDGTTGYGEACTLGGNYIDGFPRSARAAVEELAPVVLKHDVLDPRGLNAAMDAALIGHKPGKAAIDAALWDLRGKLLGLPAASLLGGIRRERFPHFTAVSLGEPAAMARKAREAVDYGLLHVQLKLGDDPIDDANRVAAVYEEIGGDARFITCDANTGWSPADARRFLTRIAHLDVFFEQPCKQLTDLAELRRLSTRPVMADESICSVADLLDCVRLGAADAINIKPARVGGLTRAAQLRDLAEAVGILFMVDEPMGSGISSAGIAQLAATADPRSLLCASNVGMAVTESLLDAGGVQSDGGWGRLTSAAGLGIEVKVDALGEPVFALAA